MGTKKEIAKGEQITRCQFFQTTSNRTKILLMISPMKIYSSIRGVMAIYNFDNENTWNLHITATVSKIYNCRNVAQKENPFRSKSSSWVKV